MFDVNLTEYLTLENLGVLARILVLVLLGLPGIFFFSRVVQRYITKKHSAQQGMVVSKVLLYVGVVVILISLLNELGFKLTHLIAAAGIFGIAIGFAAQTSFSNIISGFFLIAEQPFVVGDFITVGDTTGEVISIDMLSIKLRTFENKYVRIPNENILKSQVTNITHFPIRRLDLLVGIAYKESFERVRAVLLDLAEKNPLCLQEPQPEVRFSGFGSSSVDLSFVIWVDRNDFLTLKTSMYQQIKERFDEEGIEIPFPHVSVYTGSVTAPFPVVAK